MHCVIKFYVLLTCVAHLHNRLKKTVSVPRQLDFEKRTLLWGVSTLRIMGNGKGDLRAGIQRPRVYFPRNEAEAVAVFWIMNAIDGIVGTEFWLGVTRIYSE